MHDAPSPAARRGTNRFPLIADVISYGYAFFVIAAVLVFNITVPLPAGIAVMVLFVVLRGMAREIHKNARRADRRVGDRRAG